MTSPMVKRFLVLDQYEVQCHACGSQGSSGDINRIGRKHITPVGYIAGRKVAINAANRLRPFGRALTWCMPPPRGRIWNRFNFGELGVYNDTIDVDMSCATFADGRYECPRCRCLTDSLKRYIFMRGVFLIFGSGWNHVAVVCCPCCMRRFLIKWVLVSLLTMNLLWPIAVLPVFITRYVSTFRRGHNLAQKTFWIQSVGIVAQLGIIGGTMVATVAIISMLFGSSPEWGFSSTLLGGAVLAIGVMVVLGTRADI